jgi:hypothetical protein
MGAESDQRQRAYRDYVLSCRDREEEELTLKMSTGVLGNASFHESILRQGIDSRRPKRGRPKLIAP